MNRNYYYDNRTMIENNNFQNQLQSENQLEQRNQLETIPNEIIEKYETIIIHDPIEISFDDSSQLRKYMNPEETLDFINRIKKEYGNEWNYWNLEQIHVVNSRIHKSHNSKIFALLKNKPIVFVSIDEIIAELIDIIIHLKKYVLSCRDHFTYDVIHSFTTNCDEIFNKNSSEISGLVNIDTEKNVIVLNEEGNGYSRENVFEIDNNNHNNSITIIGDISFPLVIGNKKQYSNWHNFLDENKFEHWEFNEERTVCTAKYSLGSLKEKVIELSVLIGISRIIGMETYCSLAFRETINKTSNKEVSVGVIIASPIDKNISVFIYNKECDKASIVVPIPDKNVKETIDKQDNKTRKTKRKIKNKKEKNSLINDH